MWQIKSNIDLLQLDFNSRGEDVFFPESVNFRGKKIDTITIVTAYSGFEKSPFDNRELLTADNLKNVYIDLYDKSGHIIAQNLNASTLSPYGVKTITINRELNLKLSAVRYVGTDYDNKCCLVYVSYADKESDVDELPLMSVAVDVRIAAGEKVKLSDYISDYFVHSGKKIKAIETWNTYPFYLDLRLNNNHVMRMLHSSLFDFHSYGEHTQPFLVDDLDVDFRNSYIYNPTESDLTCILTLYY
ncbi:MAG: hypothetical protein ACI30B_07585 [Paludibacteraceae bacterium]